MTADTPASLKGHGKLHHLAAHGAEEIIGRTVVAELREKEAMLLAAQRLARIGSWSIEVPGGALRSSEEAHRIFGFAHDEWLDVTLSQYFERVHPGDRAYVEDLLRQLCQGPFSCTYQYRFLAPDGQEKWVRGEAESQLDSEGQVCRIVGTLIDVTEQEQIRQEKGVWDARLCALRDSSVVWLWEQDEEFRFTMAFSGREDQQLGDVSLVGKCRWDIPESSPVHGTWTEHLQHVQARKPFREFEYRVGHGAAARIVSCTGAPVFAADGRFVGYRGTAHEVTGLKKAQADAQQAQALLKVAARLGRVGGWVLELPQMNLVGSTEFSAIHELAEGAPLTVRRMVAHVLPPWRGSVLRALQSCTCIGTPVDMEVRAATATGKVVWLRLVAESVRDSAGAIRRVQGAVQDITESKAAAEQVAALTEELTATLEGITDGFAMLDPAGRFTYVNQEGSRLLGSSREALLGTMVWEVFAVPGDAAFRNELQTALLQDQTRRFERYSSTFDKWLLVVFYPSAKGFGVYLRDISESHRAAQALLESEERYRLLFETSGDAIIEASPSAHILRANPAACALFGRTQEELRGLKSPQLVAPCETRLASMVQERLRRGKARGELTLIRADGTSFPAEVATSMYRTTGGVALTNIVVRDITERLLVQQKMLALNEELGQRVRERTAELEAANSELRDFAHALAHDLKSPVAAMKAFGNALASALEGDGGAQALHYCGRMRAAADRMDQYIEALLSMARISQARLTLAEVDLSALATAVLDDLQERDPTRLLVRHVQEGLRVRGDQRLLRIVLDNLLGNAWKFTSRREGAAHISLFAEEAPEGEVVYSVRDNGAGFDMTWADKLFGTFQRLHGESEFPGTGIGLANVQRIVTRHGGRVWAHSVIGEGATFSFTLGTGAVPGDAELP